VKTKGDGADGAGDDRLYAAVDLGSHNCRMLVARPAPGGFRVVDAFSRIVRLGEGLAAGGALSEAAMARAVRALGVCARKMRRLGVVRARGVATEACRRAANCADFLARAEAETGLALEVISSREEARLALAGCLPLLDSDRPRAVLFDIGGGSTEVVWLACETGRTPRILASVSLPCGVIRFAEAYGKDRLSEADYAAMVETVARLLAPFDAAHGIAREIAAGRVQMIGASGTVTTLAGAHLALPRYDRARIDGLTLGFDEIARISDRLRALDSAERAAIPSIGPGRADYVVAGCAIVEAIRRLWPVGRLKVADRGLREGLLTTMIAGDPFAGAATADAPEG